MNRTSQGIDGELIELLASTVENTEARKAVQRLAETQAALRRVAILVAENAESEDLFSAVAREVAGVVDVRGVIVDRFEPDGAQVTLGSWYDLELAGADAFLGVGVRLPLHPGTLAAQVFETHRAARVEDYSKLEGMMGDAARAAGVGSGCAAPVVVDGQLWGQMCVFSAQGTVLPQGTEHRLDDFVQLVGIAISNHDARARLRMLADEQAALRRLATLVANESSLPDVLAAIADEVADVLGDVDWALIRDDGDGMATMLAASVPDPTPSGRVPIDTGTAFGRALLQGRPDRMDYTVPRAGDIAQTAYKYGVHTAVSCPLVVRGRVWGAMSVGFRGDLPPPLEAESAITRFGELMATAVANAEARAEVQRLADEQAALRRVATLVAQGAPALEIFSAVSDEVAGLLGTPTAAVSRFDHEDPAIVTMGLSAAVGPRVEIGTRFELDDQMVATQVYRTGRSAWVGPPDLSSATPQVAEFHRLLNRVSSVSSPIVVDGLLWGAITVTSHSELLPMETQERLEKFTELVATAIANADSRAELTASRARIVAASDDARRRIERDLHDGAQQRLVSLGLELRMAAEGVPTQLPELDARLRRVADEIDGVIDDLREMSRGIHPAVLSDGGLGPAIEMLARRASVPVDIDLGPSTRFAAEIEVAAYYVVSEALTNTAKHANASQARVVLEERNDRLYVSVQDDGDGGAELKTGSGLTGLRDRVEALGGSLRLNSPRGQGTTISVELPVAAPVS